MVSDLPAEKGSYKLWDDADAVHRCPRAAVKWIINTALDAEQSSAMGGKEQLGERR